MECDEQPYIFFYKETIEMFGFENSAFNSLIYVYYLAILNNLTLGY